MIKSFIFYISLQPGDNRQMLAMPNGRGTVYVRVEEARSIGDLAALTEAKPQPGEAVMNTHSFEVE